MAIFQECKADLTFKTINIIHYINRIEKNHIIISKDVGKTICQNSASILDKKQKFSAD